jgi:GNAT superfamily N-acetyltransferase
MNLTIAALADLHERQRFSCGVEALDRWFHDQAGQSHRKRRTTVWVATEAAAPNLPLGYYSLAPFHLAFDDAPEALRRKLPKDPLYVALIARLAVSTAARGRGLGGILLIDAVKRAYQASLQIPTHGVVVHAKDESAAAFYRHFGFLAFADDALHLYLPMATIAALP